jgi:hypothetical protein
MGDGEWEAIGLKVERELIIGWVISSGCAIGINRQIAPEKERRFLLQLENWLGATNFYD